MDSGEFRTVVLAGLEETHALAADGGAPQASGLLGFVRRIVACGAPREASVWLH